MTWWHDDDGIYIDEDHERQAEAHRRAVGIGGLVCVVAVVAAALVVEIVGRP